MIWKARRDLTFNEKKPNPLGNLIIARTQCYEFLRGTKRTVPNPRVQIEGSFSKKSRPQGVPLLSSIVMLNLILVQGKQQLW